MFQSTAAALLAASRLYHHRQQGYQLIMSGWKYRLRRLWRLHPNNISESSKENMS